MTVFATIQNLFDTDYETFGLLADPTEVDAFAQFADYRFFGPAPPLGGWVGLRVSLWKPGDSRQPLSDSRLMCSILRLRSIAPEQ